MKLFIHIGQPKTGSSSIQTYFSNHVRDLLNTHGIWYPITDQGVYSSTKSPEEAVAQFHQMIASGLRQDQQIHTVVLSHEGFLAQEKWAKALRSLADSLHAEPIILCYLRRQDIWLESAWKQWGAKHIAFPTIQDYLKVALPNLDWMKQLRPWLAHFGRDRMVIRRFERREIGEDVVQDFMHQIGHQPWHGAHPTSGITDFVNRGFTSEVIDLLSLLKTDRLHDNSLLDLFEQSLGEEFKKRDPFAPYGLLSQKERNEILQACAPSNKEINSIFFGGSGELFEPVSDHQYERECLTETGKTQGHIKILLEIIHHQDKRIRTLESRLLAFEELVRELRHQT